MELLMVALLQSRPVLVKTMKFCQLFCILWRLQKVEITEFDRENFKIKARGFGETFLIGKHPQGADIKAITYSNMQIHENEEKSEVFVIVDIWWMILSIEFCKSHLRTYIVSTMSDNSFLWTEVRVPDKSFYKFEYVAVFLFQHFDHQLHTRWLVLSLHFLFSVCDL